MRNKKNKEEIEKILLLCKFTYAEKYEKVYSLLYFRSNMLLIIEFPDEKQNELYLDGFQKLMTYYQKRKIKLKETQISDELTVIKQIKFLIDFNQNFKYDFFFTDRLISHDGLDVTDKEILTFRPRPNPLKIKVEDEDLEEEKKNENENEQEEGEGEGENNEDVEEANEDDSDDENKSNAYQGKSLTKRDCNSTR